MKTTLAELAGLYTTSLEDYLRTGGEKGREKAYEIGRQALREGIGVIEMATLHNEAAAGALSRIADPERVPVALQRTAEFFIECMSSFEMTHRAYHEANLALRRLNATLEDEIRRISLELHDQAGQLLAAAHIKLDEVAHELPSLEAARIHEVKRFLDQIEVELRRLSHELRPVVLDDLGLGPALRFLAETTSKRAGVLITVEIHDGPRLPRTVETTLYRIVQEALTNVTRHAHARHAEVKLRPSERTIICTVRDDGVGFDPQGSPPGSPHRSLGLTGIRERANALGGSVQINSVPGRGTELQISLPIGSL